MGTRASDSEDTRRRIVATATDHLKEVGVAKFSMRAVAKGAGLSPGTVSYYFMKKDELIDAVLEPVHDMIAETIADAMQAPAEEALTETAKKTVVALFRRLSTIRDLVQLRMTCNLTRGTMSEFHGEHNVFPAFEEVESFLGDRVSRTQMRLFLQSISVLAMRYIIHPPHERLALTGRDPKDESALEAANQDIEDHLAIVAQGVLSQIVAPLP